MNGKLPITQLWKICGYNFVSPFRHLLYRLVTPVVAIVILASEYDCNSRCSWNKRRFQCDEQSSTLHLESFWQNNVIKRFHRSGSLGYGIVRHSEEELRRWCCAKIPNFFHLFIPLRSIRKNEIICQMLEVQHCVLAGILRIFTVMPSWISFGSLVVSNVPSKINNMLFIFAP